MTRTTKRSARRAGFTLVEMLVVVTIIGILLSLTAAAALQLIGTQQATNTQDGVDAARRRSAAGVPRRGGQVPQGADPHLREADGQRLLQHRPADGAATIDRNRARVIWAKLRLKQTFPNNFDEAWNPSPMPRA